MKSLVKRKAFLKAFALCGNITVAAKNAGVDRHSHLNWLRDPEYAREFEAAKEHACDLLVEEARRRAHDGWEEPVIYQGELQFIRKDGKASDMPLTIRKFDSTLLMFLIKGMRPEVYRDTWKGELVHRDVSIPKPAGSPDLSKLNDQEYEQFKQLIAIACNGSVAEAVPGPDAGGG